MSIVGYDDLWRECVECICTDTNNTPHRIRSNGRHAYTDNAMHTYVYVCIWVALIHRRILAVRASDFVVVERQSATAFPERRATLYVKITVKCARSGCERVTLHRAIHTSIVLSNHDKKSLCVSRFIPEILRAIISTFFLSNRIFEMYNVSKNRE